MSRQTPKQKKSYASVVATPVVVEREPANPAAWADRNKFEIPDEPIIRPTKAPWSENGKMIGVRHFGPLCLPNPLKSTGVKVLMPDPEPSPESEPKNEASSCAIL